MKERVELAVPNKRVKKILREIKSQIEYYPAFTFSQAVIRSEKEDLSYEENNNPETMNLWGFIRNISHENEKILIDYALRGKKYVKLVVKPEEF